MIEAVRLAEALAALRGRPLPGLDELDEARARRPLLGEDTPDAADPPQADRRRDAWAPSRTRRRPSRFSRTSPAAEAAAARADPRRRPRCSTSASRPTWNGAACSIVSDLLGVPWGTVDARIGQGDIQGSVAASMAARVGGLLDRGERLGPTVADAASALAADLRRATKLPALTALLDRALLADLPSRRADHGPARVAGGRCGRRDPVDARPAAPGEPDAYGSVRQTDAALVARASIGHGRADLRGPAAGLLVAGRQRGRPRCSTRSSCRRVDRPDGRRSAPRQPGTPRSRELAAPDTLHGLVAGRCVRILLDALINPTRPRRPAG